MAGLGWLTSACRGLPQRVIENSETTDRIGAKRVIGFARNPQAHADVTVLFAHVVDFTPFTEQTEPARVVSVLDEIFSAFDALAERHGLEKIKTIGDAHVVAAGLPEPRADHAQAMAEMALDMQAEFVRLCEPLGLDLAIRIGMDSGPVIAGVIGRHKFTYDLWGDTVNTASRMESHGLAGRIQVSEATYGRFCDRYEFEDRGDIEVKGKGRRRAYLLVGRRGAVEPTPYSSVAHQLPNAFRPRT
jgi:class 3 adenylate cyclase